MDAQAQAWVAWANAQPVARLAMDVPSGLDADTGAAQDVCVQATHTLTFIADKPGLHTRTGSDVAGTIEVDDLQLSVFVDATADASANTRAAPGRLIRKADCASLFQTRKHDTHKGSYGTLAVLAGAPGMTGAALLASRAALLTGAGKVFVALADRPPLSLPCDPVHPELMVRDATGVLDAADALGIGTWVAGCGLATDDAARGWLTRVLRERPDANVVLDADALTLLAADPGLQTLFRQRQGVKVLTPHPLEAARLLGGDTHAVQADRIGAACAIASRFGAWVVLKGAGTVVSSPAGAWRVNTSGNPGLATAGTGDVLSGMLGALVAQGLPPEDAVAGGVWLHGAAADRLVEQGIGPIGLTASDVADAARWIRNHG
ncbi:NAD(P)H-hydrate dehydratase [Pigmentiphaga litoralis]|uniref:NAD(P)H-hydrate dehydratase n=1 Tax=Pigmentiphaga litoralis TaxID=516702 RepID=UPI003B43447A